MATQRTRQPIERNLAMELARVTEAAAMAAVRHMGMGDKELVDQAAVDAMRYTLGYVSMDGVVVIGEGEKDEAPMLYNGEVIGNGMPPEVDIAVDPIDGTTLLSKGLPGAVAVVALSARGTMNVPGNVFYMNKIAVGPDARDAIDIEAGVTDNLRNVAEAKGCAVHDLTVIMLDRPRHNEMLAEVRGAGARVKMISDGDIVAGIQAALPGTGVDMLLGIGGSPEAVLTAAAIRCIGGAIHLQALAPRRGRARARPSRTAWTWKRSTTRTDLVGGEDVFFSATGASTGDLLKGVRFMGGGAQTQSLVMRSRSGTVRWIDSIHDFSRLDKIRFED